MTTPDRERLIADLEEHMCWRIPATGERCTCHACTLVAEAAAELRRLGDIEARLEAAEKLAEQWHAETSDSGDVIRTALRICADQLSAALNTAHPTSQKQREEG